MQALLRLSRWIDALNRQIGRLTSWLVLLMVLVGGWNVVGRYVGYALGRNLSSNALIETQWYIFDLVFLPGAAYTLQQDDHVRVDVFYGQWPSRRQVMADLFGTLFFLIPFCLMVIGVSWNAVLASWAIQETSPDPGGLLRYPIKAMIIVCFGLLILQGVSQAIKSWAILTHPTPPQEQPHDPGL